MTSLVLDISGALEAFTTGCIEAKLMSERVANLEAFKDDFERILRPLTKIKGLNSTATSFSLTKGLKSTTATSFAEWSAENGDDFGHVIEMLDDAFEEIAKIWFPFSEHLSAGRRYLSDGAEEPLFKTLKNQSHSQFSVKRDFS